MARRGWLVSAQASNARVTQWVRQSTALSQLTARYPWLESLLAAVYENRLRLPASVQVTLAELTEVDARRIGKSLATTLCSVPNAAAAVDEWRLQYRAMQ